MVIFLISNNSFYKSIDILNNNNRIKIKNYFNPYEYNFESIKKDLINNDLVVLKSKDNLNKKINNK